MSVHLSIDVDLTILDDGGNLKPGEKKFLNELSREPDYRLTLWSSAGAEYARAVAEKFNLAAYFVSFASKPDVCVDDSPASLEQAIAIQVREGDSWPSTVDSIRQGVQTLNRIHAWYACLPEFIRRMECECDPLLARLTTLVWSNRRRFVRWPKAEVLLWKGLRRRNEHSNPRCYKYPADVLARLQQLGIDRDTRSNGPAIAAFKLAGGVRPKRRDLDWGWAIHHIYDGRFVAPHRTRSLHATQKGDHFTNSAGLVALHPIADGLAGECGYFAWLLRFEAFVRFHYDPDSAFATAS